VQPLAGTAGVGFPFVGAAVPFGMVQAGPDTALPGRDDQVNYTGYAYQDPMIRGFSLTHFSGAGAHLAGDVSILPVTGGLVSTDANQYASAFSHAEETPEAASYSVSLATYQTEVQVAATTRGAAFRFTFPEQLPAHVLLNAARNIAGAQSGAVQVVGRRQIEGWTDVRPNPVGYRVYFAARFDRDVAGFGTWDGSGWQKGSRTAHGAVGAYVDLDTGASRAVEMRVAISYVDLDGARANLEAELPDGTTFAHVRARAARAWDAALDRVRPTGGTTAQQQLFATCLYRALLMPSVFDDTTGRYRGFDGRTHRVPAGRHHYTNLSLWDTYRTQSPLLSLIAPDVLRDVVTSLLADADQSSGVLPRWVMANGDTGVMSGYPAVLTIAPAIMNGVVPPDLAKRAYRTMLAHVTRLRGVRAAPEAPTYSRLGWVPFDRHPYAASDTLEYALADAALLRAARRYGTAKDVALLTRRAASWRNLLDPATRFLRPRNTDGSWANPSGVAPVATYDPSLQDGYQEGTGWQYLWSVPQDVPGLVRAVGGPGVAESRLDQFFSESLADPTLPVAPTVQQHRSFFGVYYLGDQYTPGNEPDLWTPWFYNWLDRPDKAQKVVQAAMQTFSTAPDGWPGNDDAGSLSSWYLLAALGLYKVDPGGGEWALSTPLFPTVRLALPAGRSLTITTSGASNGTRYVTGATLDGRKVARPFLADQVLRRGGRYVVTVADAPRTTWTSDQGVLR
jgi:predicted alpha-1,2-mannosidase